MPDLGELVRPLREALDAKSRVRNETLGRTRELVRLCANAIRATHRSEFDRARELLAQADPLVDAMLAIMETHPDIYHAGYTQDALKEYGEAHITLALITDSPIPTAAELELEPAAYLNGLAEAMGEMRRHVLDLIRADRTDRAEVILSLMDEAYWQLVTIDFPDAVIGNLRRNTDMVRGVLERTRADLTTSQEQLRLRQAIARYGANLGERFQ